jgi:tRNA(Ile)-lysidine synthase TilS/MesJ
MDAARDSILRGFHRNFGGWFANKVLLAIRKYGLIEPGEKVCVALSGGKDSTALLYILDYLRRYSSLDLELSAAHVITGRYTTGTLKTFCAELGVPYREVRLSRLPEARVKNHCYLCARLKRGALFSLLSGKGIRKIAFGHYATDVAETFLMNLIGHGKLGIFCPRVEVGAHRPVIIRPLIYLEESVIKRIHRHARLPLLDHDCPYAKDNGRACYKQLLSRLARQSGETHLAERIVRALENIDDNNSMDGGSRGRGDWARRTGVPQRCNHVHLNKGRY